MKKHAKLKQHENTEGLDAWASYVSDIKMHELDKLNKKTVIEMFEQI